VIIVQQKTPLIYSERGFLFYILLNSIPNSPADSRGGGRGG